MTRSSLAARHRSLRLLLRSFADYAGWRGVRAAALLAVAALLDGMGLLLLVPILGVVVAPEQSGAVTQVLAGAGAGTPAAQLGVLMAVFVALTLARAFVLRARDLWLAQLQTDFVRAERSRLLTALARAPWHRVVRLSQARLSNLIGAEIQRFGATVQQAVLCCVYATMLAIQLAVAFIVAPALAAVALLLLGAGVLAFLRAERRVHALGTSVLRGNQALLASAAGFYGGFKAAAAQRAQQRFVDEFEAIQADVADAIIAFQRRTARTRTIFAIGSGLLGAAIVYVGFAILKVSPASLIAVVLVFGRAGPPALQLQQTAQQFLFGLPGFDALRALEAELSEADDPDEAETIPPPGPLVLAGVRYRHPGGGGVDRVDLTLAPGEFVALAGPSGAGKTTLVDIVTGLLVPQAGSVLVGGVPLDAAARRGWQRDVAYVPQDGFLFNDSVRRNLTWACPDASEAALAAALAMTGADAVVARLPEGLGTMVGERGAMLSGGERQRIALARALVRLPRLLVLDEAMNALDEASETLLLERLRALAPRPTIVMISHRAASLAWCDRVIPLVAGIADDGSGAAALAAGEAAR